MTNPNCGLCEGTGKRWVQTSPDDGDMEICPCVMEDNEHEELIRKAEEAGLYFSGYDEDGEPEFIGKREAWQRFNKLDNESE